MNLIVTEKNDAAAQIARLLSDAGKPASDKVYNTPVYRFRWNGDDCVAIGLRGHILEPDFPDALTFDDENGWYAVSPDGEMLPADIPDGLARPPYPSRRKPFLADGVDIKSWKVASLPYLVWAPIEKNPAEKEIIRSLKNLAKKADRVIIGTDFDREGELIGSDALRQVLDANPGLPASRARYSAFTKAEIDHAFSNLVDLDQNLADAGESRQYIDLIWGAVLTRYLTMARYGGFGNVRSAGRVQTPTLALVVERERERLAFVPEDYWVISGEADKDDDTFRIGHATARFKDGYGPVGAWFLLFKAKATNAKGEDYCVTNKAMLKPYQDRGYATGKVVPTCLRNHMQLREMREGRGPIYMDTKTALLNTFANNLCKINMLFSHYNMGKIVFCNTFNSNYLISYSTNIMTIDVSLKHI